ncbi:MAG: M61 family metallopeptidase [Phycisphaerales bacterium]
MMTFTFCVLAAAMALSVTSSEARANTEAGRVEYVIDLMNARTQTVDITLNIRGWKGDTIDVHLPVWRPGRYEVLDTAGTIRSIRARGKGMRELKMEKVAKSSWRIETDGSDFISVTYTVFANQVDNRTRHVDDTHAFLSGSSVFLFVHELRNAPIEIAVRAPEGWKIASGLDTAPGNPNILIARDYDVLADSPLEIGLHETFTYEVDGVPHELVFWGKSPTDPKPFLDDFARFTKTQRDVFGSLPYNRYVFITHIGPNMRGGTEHLNSTIIQARPDIFTDRKRYESFLSLASHELFHTWNVKQMRPAGLKPYDYMRENYTKLLWVAEGTTNYYDTLMITRAGIITPDAYLGMLAGTLAGELTRPGRTVQSLEDSSFDAWIKFNKPTPDSVNSTVNFYTRGEIVNFTIDAEIRRVTDNKKSLDDAMRLLYERYPYDGPHYTTEDLFAIFREVSGVDFTEFHRAHVAGTQDPDIDRALDTYGLRLIRGGANSESHPDGTKGYVGLEVTGGDDSMEVSAVLTDGDAYTAGVQAGDRIKSVNGEPTGPAAFTTVLNSAEEGTSLELKISRRGRELNIPVKVTRRPAGEWTIERDERATDNKKAAYEAWLGAKWPAPKADPQPADSGGTTRVPRF